MPTITKFGGDPHLHASANSSMHKMVEDRTGDVSEKHEHSRVRIEVRKCSEEGDQSKNSDPSKDEPMPGRGTLLSLACFKALHPFFGIK
ncbi:hypothetical protein [Humisphaera borealis]|uniref:Uncharacterized protein n=1 Tax=Humisphaera borealis TaxID=2807512 RepID=A0A7M2X3Z4_9BACT|nr:hypothetical protein [Humisphaera borealis]QOV91480.1 hypothetical protein IPV69_09040 [Humisphaera borealis]